MNTSLNDCLSQKQEVYLALAYFFLMILIIKASVGWFFSFLYLSPFWIAENLIVLTLGFSLIGLIIEFSPRLIR